ncbi:MAG TPA: ABC transporter permease, partial [Verrucomicrobiae bacterium]|nr:ABC transporter permease [Verrucomicrobiae bacterium]
MTSWTLILRSLRFHARAHLGVVLGATVGSTALVGALVVGDSVRESLRELALLRLGRTEYALNANDRFFRAKLADDIAANGVAPVLQLPGTAASIDGAARANRVQVLGVNHRFWSLAGQPPAFGAIPKDAVVLNSTLADQLKARVGDTILLRLEKPSLLSRDVPISPQEDYAVATRLKVHAIVFDAESGRFSLQANQVPPFNAFVPIETLQESVNLPGRANMLLVGQNESSAAGGLSGLSSALRSKWQLADAELELRELPVANCLELRTSRIFIDPPAAEAALKAATNAQPILTYFVNELRDGPRAAPYSMVTAMGAPVVPADMRDDEILVNDWLADDLQAKPGDKLSLTYYVIGSDRKLIERQSEFRVHGVVPMAGAAADPTLMPDFPGIAKAESSHDWDAGFAIQLNKIRDQDEKYWKEHRGTPKAFVTLV